MVAHVALLQIFGHSCFGHLRYILHSYGARAGGQSYYKQSYKVTSRFFPYTEQEQVIYTATGAVDYTYIWCYQKH